MKSESIERFQPCYVSVDCLTAEAQPIVFNKVPCEQFLKLIEAHRDAKLWNFHLEGKNGELVYMRSSSVDRASEITAIFNATIH